MTPGFMHHQLHFGLYTCQMTADPAGWRHIPFFRQEYCLLMSIPQQAANGVCDLKCWVGIVHTGPSVAGIDAPEQSGRTLNLEITA